MKIARYKYEGKVSYGILKDELIVRIEGDIFFNDIRMTDDKVKLKEVKLLNPVCPPNIIGFGLNYRKHAVESGLVLPERPVMFLKSTSSVIGPDEVIKLPELATDEVDYEAELAVIIGKEAKNVSPEEASEYVLGYTCANDVSARDCQFKLDQQWVRSKSFDTFSPLGPWIETELDPENCKICSKLNGQIMQQSNTSDMIFSTAQLISYCSKNMTLLPGTVILTGTPEGVGFAREPEVFLKSGDKIEIEIEGIGRLSNHVTEE